MHRSMQRIAIIGLPKLCHIRPAFSRSARSKASTHLSVVDGSDGSNHLRDDDHISQVSLDRSRLLIWLALLLCLSELLDERQRLCSETSLEASACSGVHDLHELVVGHVEEVVELCEGGEMLV